MKWIKVKDSLPDTNRDVLVCEKYSDEVLIASFDKHWNVTVSDNLDAYNDDGGATIVSLLDDENVEAWMELPESLNTINKEKL